MVDSAGIVKVEGVFSDGMEVLRASTMQKDGRVTIPFEVRAALRLQPEDLVLFRINGPHVVLEKAK